MNTILDSFEDETLHYESQLDDIRDELHRIHTEFSEAKRKTENGQVKDSLQQTIETQIIELNRLKMVLALESKLNARIKSFGNDLVEK